MTALANLPELNAVMRELAQSIRGVAKTTRDTARKSRGHRDAPSMMQMAELYDGWAGIIEASTDALAALAEPEEVALTPTMLADALGCFWNAALGAQSVQYEPTARATVGGMAEGFAAVETRLRELSAPPAAKGE